MDQAHIDFWLKEFERFTTAIVANGEVPSSGLSMRLLRKMKRIICCDGALQKLSSINIIPDVIVGDGDSMDREELSRHDIPYHADHSEEYNDLQKALKYCQANGYGEVLLMGCGGLREDHFIANLSILAMYSKEMHLTMLTEHGVFNVLRGTSTFHSLPGMQVSVFARSPHIKLTFTGLKYPVNDRVFKWLWEGSLNEAAGEEFIVEASDDEPVVVYRAL
jgi:thiamine pyrophosphokinase